MRVKLTFLRDRRERDDISIELRVSEGKREAFEQHLGAFLGACEGFKGRIKIETVDDAVTHQPCIIQISIAGNQELFIKEFQTRGRLFKEASDEQVNAHA